MQKRLTNELSTAQLGNTCDSRHLTLISRHFSPSLSIESLLVSATKHHPARIQSAASWTNEIVTCFYGQLLD